MSVETQIEELKNEMAALKTSFNQVSMSLDVYTTSLEFSTSPNQIQWNSNNLDQTKPCYLFSLDGTSDLQGNHNSYGRERVEVTFDCDAGINTFASLEIDLIDANDWAVWVKRVPYSGGARWIVLLTDNAVLSGGVWQSWKANVVKFTVQSAAPGTLGAKMIWQ